MKKVDSNIEKLAINKLNSGLSYRETARELKISVKAVSNIHQRNNLKPSICKNGRKRIFSNRQRRAITRMILSGEAKTAVNVQSIMASSHNVQASISTVKRELNRAGFKAKKKVKKPLISKRVRKLRLEFAKKYENWTFDDWKKVIWTDESKINMFGTDGIMYSWKKEGTKLNDRDIIPTVKYGGGKLLFWGCFCASGVGELVRIDGIMNSDVYIGVLNAGYLPSLRKWRKQVRSVTFMQDNDPKHKSKKTMDFLRSKKFKILDWPPQSPDINPIENLWSIVKRRVYAYETRAKNMNELWDRVGDIWTSITKEECENLVRSVPRRLQEVIKAKGGPTKY
jgi:transposase